MDDYTKIPKCEVKLMFEKMDKIKEETLGIMEDLKRMFPEAYAEYIKEREK